MAKADLRAVGITAGVTRHRVAASATRTYAGKPLKSTLPYTTGVATAAGNTVAQCADNEPIIGTDEFRGICSQDFTTTSITDTTIIAHYTEAISFIPYATKVRGQAETKANIDTQTELTGVLGDLTRFHRSSAPVYRIQAGGEADTGGLQIVDGNISRGTLDCFVDARVMRSDVT